LKIHSWHSSDFGRPGLPRSKSPPWKPAQPPRHLMRGRVAAAVAGLGVIGGFSVSRVGVTNQNLPLAYGDQAGMQLFLWSGSAFIIWVCLSVIHACLEFW
jgi:hypothetical protein